MKKNLICDLVTVFLLILFLIFAVLDYKSAYAASEKEIKAASEVIFVFGGFDGKPGIQNTVPLENSISYYLKKKLGPRYLVINLSQWQATEFNRFNFEKASHYCYAFGAIFAVPYICEDEYTHYHAQTTSWRGTHEQLWTAYARIKEFKQINPKLKWKTTIWLPDWTYLYSNAFGSDQYKIAKSIYSELGILQSIQLHKQDIYELSLKGKSNIVLNLPEWNQLRLYFLLYTEKAAHNIPEDLYNKGLKNTWNSIYLQLPGVIPVKNDNWDTTDFLYPKDYVAKDIAGRICNIIVK